MHRPSHQSGHCRGVAASARIAATAPRWVPLLDRWRAWATDATPLGAVRLLLDALLVRFDAPADLLAALPSDGPSEQRLDAAVAGRGVELARATGMALERDPIDPVEVAHLLASVYEVALPRPQRRGGGVFYTPPSVAHRLVALAFDGLPLHDPIVLDPACGAGTFLVAAADRLHRHGGRDAPACVAAMHGRDVDGDAVAVARTALAWWCWQRSGLVAWPGPMLRVGDGLAPVGEGGPPPGAATVVVGNPPFLNQLQGRTARAVQARTRAHDRFGVAAKGYVDTAVLFLLAGIDAVADGGRVVLVQPESTVVTSHAAAARAEVARRTSLEAMWFGGSGIFAAGVRVCAPILRRDPQPVEPAEGVEPVAQVERVEPAEGRAIGLLEGPDVTPSGRFDIDSPSRRRRIHAGDWAPLLAAARGVPSVEVQAAGTLGDLAGATAGFRDQFYGLVPFVVEDGCATRAAPLVTSGLIDPAGHAWGHRPVRFAGRRWQRPVVDLDALAAGDARLHDWVTRRLRPKLLLATQTRVLHAAADPAGRLVPSVPVISVEPHDADDLWLVAAVLWAPVLSVLAAERFAGAGLSATALRLSARQVLSLPTPQETGPWQRAAALLRVGDTTATRCELNGDGQVERRLGDVARLMAAAYRVAPEAVEQANRWWQGL